MAISHNSRDEAIIKVADHVGELINFWGFSPHCGRIWTLLFLNPDPMTATQISDRLRISTGLTSQAINELLRWDVIHRIRKVGGPGYLYKEETNIWKCITRVLNEREMGWLVRTDDVLSEAISAIKSSDRDSFRNMLVTKLQMLQTLTKGMKGFLKAISAAQNIEGGKLRKLLQISALGRA